MKSYHLFSLFFALFSAVFAIQAHAEPIASVRALGVAAATKSNYSCKGSDKSSYRCYDLNITGCEGVAASAIVTLYVKSPTGIPKGTITFHSGASGKVFWTAGPTGTAQATFNNLVAAGYTGIQVKWKTGWNWATSTGKEGPMKLACRAATALKWINTNLHTAGKPMCATGNSGGSAQITYAVSHYGLSNILDAIIPTSGPGVARIDEGCLGSTSAPLYLINQTGLVDSMYGAVEGQGPCTNRTMSYDATFKADSIALGTWDYYYPKTYVGMLGGVEDKSTASTAQSLEYYNRLLADKTPYVTREILANVGHSVHDTATGAQKIEQLLKAECRIH